MQGETGPWLRTSSPATETNRCFCRCENRRFTDAHHVRHWARGGETKLDNLLLLCRHHHRLVHEGGFAVESDRDGRVRFRGPGGWPIDPVPPPPRRDPDALIHRNADAGAAITVDTCVNGTGEKMDLGLAVDAMLAIADRPEQPSPA